MTQVEDSSRSQARTRSSREIYIIIGSYRALDHTEWNMKDLLVEFSKSAIFPPIPFMKCQGFAMSSTVVTIKYKPCVSIIR